MTTPKKCVSYFLSVVLPPFPEYVACTFVVLSCVCARQFGHHGLRSFGLTEAMAPGGGGVLLTTCFAICHYCFGREATGCLGQQPEFWRNCRREVYLSVSMTCLSAGSLFTQKSSSSEYPSCRSGNRRPSASVASMLWTPAAR